MFPRKTKIISFSALLLFALYCLTSCGEQKEPATAVEKQRDEIIQYTLNYTSADNGSLTGTRRQIVAQGQAGQPVEAVPSVGYRFVGWSDGVTTAQRIDQPITADLSVSARFEPARHVLSYDAGENGSIRGVAVQEVAYGGSGSQVNAVPEKRYHFVGWSDGHKEAQRVDSDVTADLEVKAFFAINQFTLSFNVEGEGHIDGGLNQTVDHGEDITVTAVPGEGFHFVAWSDGHKTATRSFLAVEKDVALNARFALNEYSVVYTADSPGTIEGATSQTVRHGGAGSEVKAVAAEGYHFVKWSDGVTATQRAETGVKDNLALHAVFEVNRYLLGGTVEGLVEGTNLVLLNKGGDDLEITSNGAFAFVQELLESDTYAVTVKSQPVAPNQSCVIQDGSGVISAGDIKNIAVTCVLNTYSIGGSVKNLPQGSTVILQNNAVDGLAIRQNGLFAFSKPLDDGSDYNVIILEPPDRPNWTCDIIGGQGTLSGSDVSDITVSCYVKAVLQAIPGLRKVKLDWNAHDFSGVVFNLCLAKGKNPATEIGECQEIEGGNLQKDVSSPYIIDGLISDISYWFRIEVNHADGHQVVSEFTEAIPFGGLNDTGIDWCADQVGNRQFDGTRAEMTESCQNLSSEFPGQDALLGRDMLARLRKLDKIGHGNAGFDFTKVCRNGKLAGERGCSPNPALGKGSRNWGCNHDNVTGLTWEVKSEEGLHANVNSYSWYSPDDTLNGGDPGMKNGGQCQGSSCDTASYIQKINELELCGLNGWRLPTRKELLSIVDNGSFKPAVDTRFFPNTVPGHYWSSSPYANQSAFAWQVYFLYGETSPEEKSQAKHVRLVSGSTRTFGLDNPR